MCTQANRIVKEEMARAQADAEEMTAVDHLRASMQVRPAYSCSRDLNRTCTRPPCVVGPPTPCTAAIAAEQQPAASDSRRARSASNHLISNHLIASGRHMMVRG